MRRRAFVSTALTGLALGVAGCASESPGTTSDATTHASTSMTASTFDLTSSAFDDGDSLPGEFGCDASDGGVSPPLSASLPDGATSWAVVVTDPDAPSGTFTHWTIWGLPVDRDLPRDVPGGAHVDTLGGASQGKNGFGDVGYGAPCPPTGDGAHHYHFDAYALDGALDADAGAPPDAVQRALDDASVVGHGRLTATYARG